MEHSAEIYGERVFFYWLSQWALEWYAQVIQTTTAEAWQALKDDLAMMSTLGQAQSEWWNRGRLQ